MPGPGEPLRPSPRWPHREWWGPLLDACSALQRANAVAGPLLSPIDVSGHRARLRARWPDGTERLVLPDPEAGAEELRRLLETSAPGRRVAPSLPDHDQVFWAPSASAPVGARYAWLLDQLAVDSTYWTMKSLRVLAVEADTAAQTADVALERLEARDVVLARVHLGAGEDLVSAPDWIAGRVRSAAPEQLVPLPPRHGRPAHRIDLTG